MFRIYILCIAALFLSACGGSSVSVKKISIPDEKANNYSHQSLQEFIKRNQGSSVVVRDPYGGSGGVSSNSDANRVCVLIERALIRNSAPFYVIGSIPSFCNSSTVFRVTSALCQLLLIFTIFTSERNSKKSAGEYFLLSSYFLSMFRIT